MKRKLTICCPAMLFLIWPMAGQQVPIYRVTVVERSTMAVNYQYRTGPTKIDFRGTVLLPAGKDEATVESLRGRTEIDAKFENLTPPTRYGPEYLTYTLWAITPEGAAHNLGEVVADGSNKAKVRVTTDLQAFGLIVTAEPYSTTHQPGDVVVMENEIRSDTMGFAKPIQAKYELMPRGQYTWHVPENLRDTEANAPKVSMDKYEAYLEIYEAQNALGIARAAGADTLAASTFQRAQGLLDEAQRLQASRSPSSIIVQNAREAAQTAEDARSIGERRRTEDKIASAQAEAARAQQAQEEAANGARQARMEAEAARSQSEADRAARQQAEADAAQANLRAQQAEMAAAQAAARPVPPPAIEKPGRERTELRVRLFEQLNGALPVRDTPRGLVVTVADGDFSGSELRGAAVEHVSRVAAIVASHPGLRMNVEGYTDTGTTTTNAWSRAEAVQRVLLGHGLTAEAVSARGLGDSRPLASNATAAGRMQNRRVEIVISGEPIGNMPFWDRTYSLAPVSSGRSQ